MANKDQNPDEVSTAAEAVETVEKAGRFKKFKREEVVAILAACVIAAGLVVGGTFLYHHVKSHSKAVAKQQAHGYTLTPPKDWAQVSPVPDGSSVAFASAVPDSDATGTLKAFIVVQSASLNQQALHMPFEDVAKSYMGRLGQAYTNFQLVSTSYKTIAGTPALLAVFTFTNNSTAVTVESLFTVKNGISYTVNGEGLSSAWAKHSTEIEASLLTFRP